MDRRSIIPIIDFSDFPGQYEELRKASAVWGCFRIMNHCVPLELMQEMKVVGRSLVERPMEIKKRNQDDVVGTGYHALSPKNPLYESIGLYDIASSQAVDTFCSQLDATPSQSNGCWAKLGESVAMGLEGDYCKEWPCTFRVIKYHFSAEAVGWSGVKTNTDSGLLTILPDDDIVGGLEVMHKYCGEFVAVDPMPGTFLVILGDMAAVWSNGRFCNLKHRVQCKEARMRLTIATFMMAPNEATMEAPAQLVDSDHPRLYAPFIYQDYRRLRLTRNS